MECLLVLSVVILAYFLSLELGSLPTDYGRHTWPKSVKMALALLLGAILFCGYVLMTSMLDLTWPIVTIYQYLP